MVNDARKLRNVVTLNDIPPDLHQWLKDEATRQSEKAGHKVRIYQLVVQAVERYRADIEHKTIGQPTELAEVNHA